MLEKDQSFAMQAYITNEKSNPILSLFRPNIKDKPKFHDGLFKKGHQPWNKGKHYSDETRRKMSIALKNKPKSEEGKRNMSLAHFGHKHSGETKLKMSMTRRGRPQPWMRRKPSEETRRKLSLASKGRHHSEETKRKISLSEKGRVNIGKIPWIKGKHLSEETKKKLSEIHKGHRYSPDFGFKKGHQWSKEILEKIGQSLKGRKFSEEHRRKMRISRLRQIIPQKDTSIEVKMQNELKSRNISFEKHLPICNVCQPDIIFPENKVSIFCDGTYWHSLPNMKIKDIRQNEILTQNGWCVLRFSDNEINNNVSACVDKILEVVKV